MAEIGEANEDKSAHNSKQMLAPSPALPSIYSFKQDVKLTTELLHLLQVRSIYLLMRDVEN